MSNDSKQKRKNQRRAKQRKYLVLKFIVKKRNLNSSDVKKLEILTHESKNLFNRANYIIREELDANDRWIRYNELWRTLKDSGEVEEFHNRNNFRFLKTGVIQQVLRQIDAIWNAHFEAMEEWRVAWRGENYDDPKKRKAPEEPWRFTHVPRKPHFKKNDGHFMLIFSYNDVKIRDDKIFLTMTETFKKKHPDLKEEIILSIPSHKLRFKSAKKERNFQLVRILPRGKFYQVEIVYKRPPVPKIELDGDRVVALDQGVTNLLVGVGNWLVRPFIVSGLPVKHANWYYNKQKAKLQAEAKKQGVNWENKLEAREIRKVQAIANKRGIYWLKMLKNLKFQKRRKAVEMKGNEWLKELDQGTISHIQALLEEKGQYWTKRLDDLLDKRNNVIENYFHQVTTAFIRYCVESRIGKIVLPVLKHIKYHNTLGKRNNQNFHYVSLDKLRSMIMYKAELVGIKVYDRVTEWYTSKVSSLDLEPICKHEKYIGKRIKSVGNQVSGRALFKGSNYILNSDVNGALNILRKVIGDDFIRDLADHGCWFQPVRIKGIDELYKLNSTYLRHLRKPYIASSSDVAIIAT